VIVFKRPGNYSGPFTLIAVGLLLAGCWSEKELIQKFAPKEDDEFARRFIELLRERIATGGEWSRIIS
jgi:hypothetical protein